MRLRVVALFLLSLAAAAVAAGGRADVRGDLRLPAAVRPPDVPAAQREPAPRCPVPAGFRRAFAAASRQTAIPTSLILALARIESSLRPTATSSAGARGLLQLLPSTAAELRLDPDDPEQNVLGGARYLRSLVDRFGSIDLALAAYNAGPTSVARAGGVPTETVAGYVDAVNAAWRELSGCA
jgi:soluble lytic murein transglycosylase-like protein